MSLELERLRLQVAKTRLALAMADIRTPAPAEATRSVARMTRIINAKPGTPEHAAWLRVFTPRRFVADQPETFIAWSGTP